MCEDPSEQKRASHPRKKACEDEQKTMGPGHTKRKGVQEAVYGTPPEQATPHYIKRRPVRRHGRQGPHQPSVPEEPEESEELTPPPSLVDEGLESLPHPLPPLSNNSPICTVWSDARARGRHELDLHCRQFVALQSASK